MPLNINNPRDRNSIRLYVFNELCKWPLDLLKEFAKNNYGEEMVHSVDSEMERNRKEAEELDISIKKNTWEIIETETYAWKLSNAY